MAAVILLTSLAVCPVSFSGATKYDITVSDGKYDTLQDALYAAKEKGTAKHPYTIHVTKNVKLIDCLRVFSYTHIYADKGVKYIKAFNDSVQKYVVRFGEPGSAVSKYYYKDIIFQGGIWDGNGKKTSDKSCFFKLMHGKNIKLKNLTIQNVAGGHEAEIAACDNVKILGCTFQNHISTGGDGAGEALQIDVNLNETTNVGKFDKYQNNNFVVYNCTFKNLERGVGSHNTIEGIYFKNMKITKNRFYNCRDYAIMCMNYRNSQIYSNTIKDCGGGIGFLNIKPDYKKNYTNSHIVKSWKLKLDTKKDNSLISKNVITGKKTRLDRKALLIVGDKVNSQYKKRYLKGDHRINGLTVTKNKVVSNNYIPMYIYGVVNSAFKNNKLSYVGKKPNGSYGFCVQGSCENVKFYNNSSQKFYDGFFCQDSKKLKFDTNTSKGSTRNGFSFFNCKSFQMKKDNITNSKSEGVYCINSTGKMNSCKINTVKDNHGVITNSKNCKLTITGGSIKNCKKYGVYEALSKIKVSKVKFSGNKKGNKKNC